MAGLTLDIGMVIREDFQIMAVIGSKEAIIWEQVVAGGIVLVGWLVTRQSKLRLFVLLLLHEELSTVAVVDLPKDYFICITSQVVGKHQGGIFFFKKKKFWVA